MSDYTKLVKALQWCAKPIPCSKTECPRKNTDEDCACHVLQDAAAAIEALQEELGMMKIAADGNGRMVKMLQAEVKSKQGELDALRVFTDEAQNRIEELQAEVNFYKKRLKEWCGVCPDNEHCDNCEIAGHGHWVPQVTEDGGHNDLLDCSLCGESIWNTQRNKNYCPNCGAKMEVQE